MRGLNPRHSAHKTDALPTELMVQILQSIWIYSTVFQFADRIFMNSTKVGLIRPRVRLQDSHSFKCG